MTLAELHASLLLVFPELILAIGGMAVLMVGAFAGDKSFKLSQYLSMLVLVLAGAVAVLHTPAERMYAFGTTHAVDAFAGYAKALVALSAAASLLLAQDWLERRSLGRPEFPVLVVMSVLGMFIMVSANDLIALYIGIEMQSLALYVLAAFARDDARSSEAGLKYFVLGALSSGLLLYGASLVYGFTGSVSFNAIAEAERSVGLIFGLVFVLCGLAFKISAAPFHMWTPDVYEGSPTPVTAFFATAPKIAAIALFARACYEAFGTHLYDWRGVVSIMATLSMGVGALFALQQTNIKRLMAYSSIANMGYALVAIATGPTGASALLLFMTVYAATSIGIFGVILTMRREGQGEVETIADLAGLSKTKPWLAVALTALLFSVAGIPPLAGFFPKLAILQAAGAQGLWALSVVLVIASVISAFYYIRLIKLMWFDEPVAPFADAGPTLAGTIVASTALAFPVLVVLIGLIDTASKVAGASLK